MGGLLDGARRGLADAGVTHVDVVRVPGTFELPVACAALADRYDALVALGVVIRGGTPHFDYVCQAATVGITDVSVRTAHADRLRGAHLRRRGTGPRPGRPARVGGGQGPRGRDGGRRDRRRAPLAVTPRALSIRRANPRRRVAARRLGHREEL